MKRKQFLIWGKKSQTKKQPFPLPKKTNEPKKPQKPITKKQKKTPNKKPHNEKKPTTKKTTKNISNNFLTKKILATAQEQWWLICELLLKC